MARSAAWLSLTAVVVAAVDLMHKAVALADAGAVVPAHERSLLYVLGIPLAATAWAAAIALTRSVSIAVAGGVVAGGAAGNLASLALWPSVVGVPNPIVLGDVAFTVADVTVAAGLALVLVATPIFAVRNRSELRLPVLMRR